VASDKEFTCQCRRCRRHGFNSLVAKIPWRRRWKPTPVLLPGKLPGKCLERGAWRAVVHAIAKSRTRFFVGHD